MANDKTNFGIVVLLIAAIAISIGSTLVSLDRLSSLGGLTGYAAEASGTVMFAINETLQIELTDNEVNFGTCALNSTSGGFINYTSDLQTGTSSEYQTLGFGCDGLTDVDGDYMILANVGNVDANVTLKSDKNGVELIEASTYEGEFWYKAGNKETDACKTGLQETWTNISQADFAYPLCGNFTAPDLEDELYIWFGLLLPSTTVPGDKTASITFTAEQAGI